MPTKVVSESHMTGDDYTMVPSVKEFKTLQSEIHELKREVTVLKSSGAAFERVVKSIQGSVTILKNTMRTLKGDIRKELTDGDWKKILEREVRAATQQLESSMSCLSTVSASKISEGIAEKMCKKQVVEKKPSQKRAKGDAAKPRTVKRSCKKTRK